MTTHVNQPIVVCVDESEAATTAVRWAADEALRRHCDLRVLTAVDESTPAMSGWPIPPEYFASMREAAEHRLERCAAVAREVMVGGSADRTPTVTKRMVRGPVRSGLIEQSRDAQLMVMGSRHPGRLARISSLTTVMASHAHCPVAFVDTEATATGTARPVVVGVDSSPISIQALDVAFAEADRRGVGLTAIHAWEVPSIDTDPMFPVIDLIGHRQAEQAVLAECMAGYRQDYPDLSVTTVIEEGHAVDVLAAASHGASLLVVGSRGRGGFTGMLLGSTSAELLGMARCPLMIVRPPEVDSAHGPRRAMASVFAKLHG
ncbi:universal stress protein [Williamsia sp. CHRR-6]|uniref:universal stress protein n=1 Tax=Williamsia sp. CHRR-6 TaxID=2835871 RepID=UPI001BD984E3|nr:universal stress protein [Williamsia sp. CHRR-6]MBT0566442.1 universal stress protein [Williamsia sp. CHRR-6]